MKEIINYVCARYFKLDEKGQGIVEYALILAFVVVLAIALTSDGGIQEKVKATFSNVAAKL